MSKDNEFIFIINDSKGKVCDNKHFDRFSYAFSGELSNRHDASMSIMRSWWRIFMYSLWHMSDIFGGYIR